MTDDGTGQNQWMNRPDLKPHAAMVPDEYTGKDTITYKTMEEQVYGKNQGSFMEQMKRKSFYRYFFPLDADFTLKSDPYATHHKSVIYNPQNGLYAGHRDDFLTRTYKWTIRKASKFRIRLIEAFLAIKLEQKIYFVY